MHTARHTVFNPRAFCALALAAALACGSIAPTAALSQTVASAAAALPAGVARVQTVEGITEYRLTNGMKVLLAPDAADARVTVNLTYMVGSRHEGYGETGMAHLLEHLIFKGSTKTPDPKAEFQKRGMQWNGTTTADRTNYFSTFESNQESLDWYIDWQADAMVGSFIAKKDLDSEMTVVRSEYELAESNPFQALFARMNATAYMWHNYGKGTIGARSDIEQVDIANLQAFYKRFYRPDNAVLIVAGKFDAARTLATIAKSLGALQKPASPIAKTYTVDTAQDGERAVVVRRPSPAQVVAASYHTPPGLHPDTPALELLGLILGDAPAGRLYKAMVETKEVPQAFASPFAQAEGGLFYVGAVVAPGDDASARLKKLNDLVEGLAQNPVTAEEFERAKAKTEKGLEQAFASASAVASGAIGMEVLGDWKSVFVRRDRFATLKLEDINRVAQQFLIRDNRTTGHLIPTEKPTRAPEPKLANVADFMKGFALKEASEQSVEFDFSIPNLQKTAVQSTTAGGIKTAVINKPVRGGLVSFSMDLDVGRLQSVSGKDIAAGFIGPMLMRGTASMTRQQIDDAFVKLGAQVSMSVGATDGGLVIVVKRENFEATLRLAAQVLKNASLPRKEFEELQDQWAKSIAGAAEDKASIAGNTWGRYGNPYAPTDLRYQRTIEENFQAVKNANYEDMVAFYKRFVGSQNATVSVVGPVEAALVNKLVSEEFDNWKAAEPYERVPYPHVQKKPTRMLLETPDKANASVRAALGVALSDWDDEARVLRMAAGMFGGGPGSRLWTALREEGGLSYSASAGADFGDYEPSGSFYMDAEVNPINVTKAETVMKAELAKSLATGFTQAELDRFKLQTLRGRKEARTGDGFAAQWLGFRLEFPERPFDLALTNDVKIEAMTLEQVNAVWRKHIKAEAFVWGIFADTAKLK